MVRDSRWPFLPVVLFRGAQLLFAITTLACAAYVVSAYGSAHSPWWAGLGIFVGLVQCIYCAATVGLYFTNRLLPLAVVVGDVILLILNLTALAGTAESGFVGSSCKFYSRSYYRMYGYTSTSTSTCGGFKGAFAGELLSMLLFIVTSIYAAFVLYRTRDDLSGKKHAMGVGPSVDDGEVQMGAVGKEPMPEPPQQQMYDPNQQYYQQQQQYAQPGTEYPQHAGSPLPQPVYSPVSSPGPIQSLPPQNYVAYSPPTTQ